MHIENHLLVNYNGKSVDFKPTPNKGKYFNPQYLIVHYTATIKANSVINWFQNSISQVSAHLLIDRDGSITQFAPFNVITWHAGVSLWQGISGLNQFSIGIELVNAGRLVQKGDEWICSMEYSALPPSEVLIASHKNDCIECGWQKFSAQQLDTFIGIASLLVKNYHLKDVLGHDDIAPIRKSDPGPAFPMAFFRSRVLE